MSGMYPEDFPEGPVAGIADDEVEDFLATFKTDRADRIADLLRDNDDRIRRIADLLRDKGDRADRIADLLRDEEVDR